MTQEKSLKKILIVSQYFWPEDFRVNELAKGLVEEGYSVDVLTGRPNYPSGKIDKEYKKNPNKFSSYKGARIYRVIHFLRGNKKFSLILNYLSFLIAGSVYSLFLSRKKYDFIIAIQLSPIFSVIPAILCKKILKKPLYFWVLDIWPDSILSATKISQDKITYRVLRAISKKIYSSADILFLTSKAFEGKLVEMNVTKSKFEYFPQWIESSYLELPDSNSPEFKEVKRIFSQLNNKKIFLFAGNIGESQNFSNLLASFAMVDKSKDFMFLILGDGRYKEQLCEDIKKFNLSKNVLLLGRYASHYMPLFYKFADVLVFSLKDLPIFSTTLPGKVQSYMSSGKAIIAMIDGESAEIINEANCGFTTGPNDIPGFSDLISHCIDLSDEDLNELGINGKNFALKEFQYSNQITKLVDHL